MTAEREPKNPKTNASEAETEGLAALDPLEEARATVSRHWRLARQITGALERLMGEGKDPKTSSDLPDH